MHIRHNYQQIIRIVFLGMQYGKIGWLYDKANCVYAK